MPSRTDTDGARSEPTGERHLWLRGGIAAARADLIASLDLPPTLAAVSAHSRRRGPYSGAGELVRAIVPALVRDHPDLVERHDTEIRVVSPELCKLVPGTRESLTSTAAPAERTRFYPRARTTRIAHGLTELISGYQRGLSGPRTVVIDDADDADASDLEFIAILLRRLDPHRIRLVVGTGADLPESLASPLARYADEWIVPPEQQAEHLDPETAAWQYVSDDCTSDDRRLRSAYDALSPARRAALHDRRVAVLDSCDELTLRLGAIPYHREHGSDQSGARVDALLFALEHCILMGFYPAVLDLAARSRTLLDWTTDPDRSWLVTAKECTALSALGLTDRPEQLYDEACAGSTAAGVHLQAAYGRAMLLTRFYDQRRRDHQKAKAHINTAICISQLLPEAEQRVFNTTFNENGLALIEMHLGDLNESLRLVQTGLDRLDRELEPGQHTLHKSVLLYNKAQLLAAMRQPAAAIGAYDTLIQADPHHSEYYFERAALHRTQGNAEAAMADYAAAIGLSPPYPEPHFNRASLALELSDATLARSDLDYVLELDPNYVDAYLNRGSLRLELGDVDGALHDCAAGLQLAPDSAHLHCLRGQAEAESGRTPEAYDELQAAIRLDPAVVAAWASLGALQYEEGKIEQALASFDRAVSLGADPSIRYNRGIAHQAAGNWAAAVLDYTHMLDALGDDQPAERAELLYRRATCHHCASDADSATRDLEQRRALAPEWTPPAGAAAVGRDSGDLVSSAGE